MSRYKNHIATALAILFHAVGLVGMLFFKSETIVLFTPIHLLLMAALLFYSMPRCSMRIGIFFACCFLVGMLAEYGGVHTGILFGRYQYGHVLGPGIGQVPLIIGVNWFVIIYCCGICTQHLMLMLETKMQAQQQVLKPAVKKISMLVDGALLAVAMDWLMEPVAVQLGYWHWLADGTIPMLNYISWFVVSFLLLALFNQMKLGSRHLFAIHLLMIQAMFFLLLRTFL